MKRLSESGVDHIILYEGLRTEAYLCPANILTIGIGHTGLVDGKEIELGMVINIPKAKELLRQDVQEVEAYLNKLGVLDDKTQGQIDSLISFVFNVGIGNFLNSTMFRKIKAGESKQSVSEEFLRWVYAGGKKLNGLIKRREDEKNMYLK